MPTTPRGSVYNADAVLVMHSLDVGTPAVGGALDLAVRLLRLGGLVEDVGATLEVHKLYVDTSALVNFWGLVILMVSSTKSLFFGTASNK